jgi:hypothetical protein
VIPTLPLRPRNRLAHLILASLQDEGSRAELARLAMNADVSDDWLEPEERERYAPPLRARAERATAALTDRPLMSPGAPLGEALDAASVLFDADLFFEVHEWLEPYWRDATGDLKEALQGMIQIAVGHQHLANDNVRGARALLTEGAARLRRAGLDDHDVERFMAAAHETLAGLTGTHGT